MSTPGAHACNPRCKFCRDICLSVSVLAETFHQIDFAHTGLLRPACNECRTWGKLSRYCRLILARGPVGLDPTLSRISVGGTRMPISRWHDINSCLKSYGHVSAVLWAFGQHCLFRHACEGWSCSDDVCTCREIWLNVQLILTIVAKASYFVLSAHACEVAKLWNWNDICIKFETVRNF